MADVEDLLWDDEADQGGAHYSSMIWLRFTVRSSTVWCVFLKLGGTQVALSALHSLVQAIQCQDCGKIFLL